MMSRSVSNSQKKFSISVIDVLILITVITCIAGTFLHYKLYEKQNAIKKDYECSVSVLINSIEPEIAEQLSVGDKLYFKDNTEFGTIAEVSAVDASVYYTNSKNEITEGLDSTKRDVTIIVKVAGSVGESGFLANGKKYVASGMDIELFSSSFSGNGLIFDVKQHIE